MRTRLLQDLQKKTIRFKSIVALTCLLLTSVSAFAQTKTVTGTVTDAANEPLIGASVLVQGTSTGTITDMDGKYSISVTPEDVLVFSYVGMTTQSVKVGAQNVINVTLKEDSQVLAETVVIGYGSAKKRDLQVLSPTSKEKKLPTSLQRTHYLPYKEKWQVYKS